jgi:hypothetical protein
MNDVLRCFTIEYINSFGFQADEAKSSVSLTIAVISLAPAKSGYDSDDETVRRIDGKEIVRRLREKTGSKTVGWFDWIGRNCIDIDYTEWELIPAVMQALIDMGDLYVVPRCKHDCSFKHGEQFSYAAMEQKTIANFRESAIVLAGGDLRRTYDIIGGRHSAFKKHYNWHTAEGKQFCTELRAALRCKKPIANASKSQYFFARFEETCRQNRFLHRGLWSSYEPSNQRVDVFLLPQNEVKDKVEEDNQDAAQDEKRSKKEDKEEERLCSICLDRPANTLVLPCEHCVVCSECSRDLEKSNDARLCVQCRRPISAVLEDGKPLRQIE